MAGNNRIGFQVGFSVDKSGLSEMQSLFQQIANKAKEPGNELKQGLQKAATTANTLDQILEKTFNTNLGTLNVTKFNQELSKSGLTLKQVKSDLSAVGNQGATAYNRLAQAVLGTNLQLKQSSKLLDEMAISMKNTVKWGITSSIFNNITNALSKAVTYSKQLDTSLNDIRIVTDKSAESMDQFAEKANAAAKQMGASTLDYTNAALIYYQQGLSDEETAARAETTIKAANVTGQTGQEVSEQLTAVWNGYKVTAEETELYVDKLAAVAATTAADLEELSTGMSKVASAANAMGVDFDDLNAQIATIVSVTRQAPESVGTALKTIYARLGDLKVDGVDEFGVKLGEVSAQLQQMGIQILDQEGNLRNMTGVIAEVAEKWNGWTEAQRQAAAVAMAGKRQYNNLIALFDNWDMYTDALETSTEAMGTLQHQQDIYMESTAAKLKTLKATWQDLYGGLIDQDELNAGIEGLTNLVQVFDNFIDSFGGGLKSIAGFGAVVANIFNKQIADSINNVIQRQEVFKQNLALAQMNADTRAADVAQLGANATPQNLAIEANTKAQLEYAQKIYDARVGLNQEQYNTLVGYQKEIGALQEELVWTEEYNKKIAERYLQEEQYIAILKEGEEAVYATQDQYDAQIDKLQKIKNIVIDITTGEINIGAAKTKIVSLSNTLYNEEKKAVQELFNQNKTTIDIEANEEKINKVLDQQIAKYKTSKSIAQQINDNRVKTVDLESSLQNTKQEADEMLRLANSAKSVTQNVTMVTSALGSMAMAWSSVNSLVQTWNDESTSFGDKLTQTFMTLGMTIPMVISSFNKLKDAFGISNSLLDVYNAKVEANTLSKTANIAVTKAETLAEESKVAISKLSCSEDEREVKLILSKISAKELEEIATEKTTVAQVANNIANQNDIYLTEQQISAISAEVAAKNAKIVATNAETAATKGATVAQNAFNASMLANPITWVIAGLVALIGVVAAVNAHYKKLREEAHAAAEESAKLASETRAEADAHAELVEQYLELKDQYDAGTASKEDLWDVTNKLIDVYGLEGSRLDMLTGKYDQVTEAIKNKQKAEQEELLRKDKQAVEDSGKAVIEEARKAGGSWLSGDKYKINLDSGLMQSPGDYMGAIDAANKIFGEGTAYKDEEGGGYIGSISFDANDVSSLTEYINKLEQWRDVLKELGYEGEPAYQSIENIINAFNDEGALDTLKENQEKTLQDILNNSTLALARTQEEFDSGIKELQNQLSQGLIDGILPSDTDIDIAIADFIGTLNNEFANKFTIEQGLKEKFGLTLRQELVDEFQKLDSNVQLKIVDLFDFSMDPEKGKELLKQYADFFTAESATLNAIPVSFQDQINDSILKGKDISKSDWESMLASNPYAEQILGDKDSFNNKSIGERISLMQQLNELTRESNVLAIEQYNTNKANSEAIIANLETQKQANEQEIALLEKKLREESYLSEEERNHIKDRIKDIQQDIVDLTDQQYEIEISLDMDEVTDNLVQSIVGDVMTEADQMKAAAEAIGEGWTVAAENVSTFAAAFPELMEGMERLEDGSLQLDKDIVNAALESAQERIKANKQVAINAAEDKIKQLKLELKFKEQQAQILDEALAGEKTAGETKAALAEAVETYKEDLLDAGLIAEADAMNEATSIEAQGVDNMITILDQLNQAINTIHNNFANMLNVDANIDELKTGVTNVGKQVTAGNVDRSALYQNAFDDSSIDAMIEARQKLTGEISGLKSDIASYEGFVSEMMNSVSEMDKAADRVKSGKAGKEDKSKSKSGGKDKKDKDDKKLDEEFDRYWEIKKAIDATDRSLKKLDKDQENLYGKELINSLHQENELLEQQAANYTALAEAQKQEAAELQSVLSGYGVAFDASGAITNYAAATAAALQQYNDAIHQYNMGLIDESTLGVYEKNYEKFKKALERYDQLFYTEMKDTEEKLDEIRRKELANNLKAWEVEIQLKLDMKDLERQWNDFIHKVTKDFKKVYSDLRVDLKNMLKDAGTYVGDEGTINTIIGGVHDVANEIDKMRFGGTSDMFESISQAQEKLKELNSQLLESGEALHDLVEQAYDNLLDGIDQVADQFDDLIDRFEKINDELEFQKQIIELLYGEEAYGLMSKYYEGQLKNTGVQIESLKQQVDFWQKEFEISGATMENQKNWTKEQQKIYEELIEAQGDLNDLVLEYIQLLKDEYLNTVKDVLKQFDNFVSGSSLENVKTQWERISDRADKYYDSVEKAYEVQNLANKMDKDIAATTNLKTQQKLKALRDSEIEFLREKEKLTQHDIEYSEAKFQIALKEAALEDAQNNKTSMKLTRNEQGNWSYQYIADEEDTASKRQELLDAYNQLYQLASDAYEKNLESMQELQEKYLQSALEIRENDTLSEDEKTQQLAALDEWYFQTYQALAEENALYREELVEAGSALLLEVYEEDQSAYEYMSETERELLDALVQAHIDGFLDLEEKLQENYQNIGDKAKDVMTETREDWTSGAQHIADIWNGDGGDSVRNQITHVYNVIEQATQHYKDMVDWCAEAVGRDFSEEGIAGAIMKAENETDNLRNKTAQLVNDSHGYLADLRRYIEEIEAAWQSVQQAIMDAIGLIQEYLKYMGAAGAAGASGGASGGGAAGGASPSGGGGSGSDSSGSKNTFSGPKEYIVTSEEGGRGVTLYRGSSEADAQRWVDQQKKKDNGSIGHVWPTYATGGYTGSWNGTEGRPALLHQKELVLNETDTKNFLSGIKMIRDLSSGASIGEAVMRAVANTALSFGTMKAGIGASVSNDNRRETSNVFNIAAEFPNANDVNEIREAILSLPNLASQYINNNLR